MNCLIFKYLIKLNLFLVLFLVFTNGASDPQYGQQYFPYNQRAINRRGCYHPTITYGNPNQRDEVVFTEVINKKAKLSERSAELNYPSSEKKNKKKITKIDIQDLNTSCDCFQKSVNITSGGVGKKFVNLKITTPKGCPNYHNVTIYAKSNRT